MSFNKAFKKRHKLLNPKRALLIFALPLAGRIHNFHKAYPDEGDGEGERGCDLARNLHLQHCKRSRAAELHTIRVYALGALTVPSQCYKKVQVPATLSTQQCLPAATSHLHADSHLKRARDIRRL